jgi:hypothetical protein
MQSAKGAISSDTDMSMNQKCVVEDEGDVEEDYPSSEGKRQVGCAAPLWRDCETISMLKGRDGRPGDDKGMSKANRNNSEQRPEAEAFLCRARVLETRESENKRDRCGKVALCASW